MWALKMKPLKRERWETCFDRRDIWFAKFTSSFMENKLFLRRILWYDTQYCKTFKWNGNRKWHC
jgi:hypothetical protein